MTRELALQQLRGLLGLDVVDVDSAANISGRFRWRFDFVCSCTVHRRDAGAGHCKSRYLRGGDLHNPRRLNAWTRSAGRDPSLPELTVRDGHEAVVLADLVIGGGQ